jgi:hypothetical protein
LEINKTVIVASSWSSIFTLPIFLFSLREIILQNRCRITRRAEGLQPKV